MSTKNTVKFTRSALHSSSKYHICMQTSAGAQCPALRSCSNGFTVDTQPPSAGNVYIGHHDESDAQYVVDRLVHVSWADFSDGATITGYVEGIAGCQVAIGML